MTEQQDGPAAIRTPDQRLRVFVSSTLGELADERAAVGTPSGGSQCRRGRGRSAARSQGAGCCAELARESGRSAAAKADLLIAFGRAQKLAGEPAGAQEALVEGATLARHATDPGRLAEAVLGASGETWQTSLDASSVAIGLLKEALCVLASCAIPRARSSAGPLRGDSESCAHPGGTP
jgi:hypothetical protein